MQEKDNLNIKEVFSGQTFALGLQHLLAMYAGAVVVPIIIANALDFTAEQTTSLIAAEIILAGIATLIQIIKGRLIGIGLPIVFACAATAIGPMIQVGTTQGVGAMYGAVLATGIIILLLAPIFAKLLCLFPPLVTNTIVTLIGLTLIPVAINYFAGGESSPTFGDPVHLMIGFITFLSILLLYRFTTVIIQSISTLLGLIIRVIAASLLGVADFSAVAEASWVQIPMPFHIARPEFDVSSTLTIGVVGIVSMIEATGIYSALSGITDTDLDQSDYRRGYTSLGIAYFLAGIFNTSPVTAFSQNVGVINMSGVKKRSVIFNLVFLMFISGLIPKIGAVAAAIPSAALGGAMIFLFGNILSYGVSELGKLNLNMENQIIIGVSLTVGMGVTVVPDAFAQLPIWLTWLTSSGVVAGAVTVVILNAFFNGISSKQTTPS